jgi:hypothetical protein
MKDIVDAYDKRRDDTRIRIRMLKKVLCKFWVLKMIQAVLGVYIIVMTFTPVGTFGKYGGFVTTSVGAIIDPASPERTEEGVMLSNGVLRAIIASNKFQMFCLGISRFSAFFVYPGEQKSLEFDIISAFGFNNLTTQCFLC